MFAKRTHHPLLTSLVVLSAFLMMGADDSGCGDAASTTTADGGTATQPAANGAPTEADIKKAFKEGEDQYDSVNRRWVVTVSNIRFGTARIGDPYKDGTPANKEVTVYPVKLSVTTTNKNKESGAVINATTEPDVTTSFFRDDFGEWTFKYSSGGG